MTLERIAEIGKAIGNIKRLQILLLLREGPKSGTELQEKLDLSQPNVSNNLIILRNSDLIFSYQNGKNVDSELTDLGRYVMVDISKWIQYD